MEKPRKIYSDIFESPTLNGATIKGHKDLDLARPHTINTRFLKANFKPGDRVLVGSPTGDRVMVVTAKHTLEEVQS